MNSLPFIDLLSILLTTNDGCYAVDFDEMGLPPIDTSVKIYNHNIHYHSKN